MSVFSGLMHPQNQIKPAPLSQTVLQMRARDTPGRRGGVAAPDLKHNASLEPRFLRGGFDSTPELIRVPRAKHLRSGILSQKSAPESLPVLRPSAWTFPQCTEELCPTWEHASLHSALWFTSQRPSEAATEAGGRGTRDRCAWRLR